MTTAHLITEKNVQNN